jgi:hypothetical protein
MDFFGSPFSIFAAQFGAMLGPVDFYRRTRMNKNRQHALMLALMLAGCGGGGDNAQAPIVMSTPPAANIPTPAIAAQPNPDGAALTFTEAKAIDRANPFFRPFGNGRSCASCHDQGQGWSLTPQGLQARFTTTGGTDPVFKLVDGANSPNAADATLDQKRVAYSMLLTRGVLRIGLPIPAAAEFTLVRADDPYGFASAAELSLFRRPLASANLAFNSSIMWDARETFADAASATCLRGSDPLQCFATLDFNLLHQANGAVRGHAQAAQDLGAADQRAIVDFERTLFHAQSVSAGAGDLTDAGALGGPARLATQAFYFGINALEVGDYRTGAPFERNVMRLFGAWRDLPPNGSAQDQARAAIGRGEGLFNNRPINVTQVAGFNPAIERATCSSCHNAPNTGSHSVARMFNTGVAAGALRTADMPLYTLRNNASGELVETTDPGGAMGSGKWSDIGKFKTPQLRGAAARAPYFHDGSARDLEAVVRFYDRRFRMGLSAQESADLAAFLKAL